MCLLGRGAGGFGKEMLNAGCRGVRGLFGVPGQGLRTGQGSALGWTKPSSPLKVPVLRPVAVVAWLWQWGHSVH